MAGRLPMALCAARASLGTAYLTATWPDRLAGHVATPAAVSVARVLGLRQLAQALLTCGNPSSDILVLGAAVDGLHAVSMMVLAAWLVPWRRAALADTLIASGLAAAGVAAARRR